MSVNLTFVVKIWAYENDILHEDVTKCGTCWKQLIQSEVSKEFLESNSDITSEIFKAIVDESGKRWKNTVLYKRVEQLLTTGKTMEEIGSLLNKEGVEI